MAAKTPDPRRARTIEILEDLGFVAEPSRWLGRAELCYVNRELGLSAYVGYGGLLTWTTEDGTWPREPRRIAE